MTSTSAQLSKVSNFIYYSYIAAKITLSNMEAFSKLLLIKSFNIFF